MTIEQMKLQLRALLKRNRDDLVTAATAHRQRVDALFDSHEVKALADRDEELFKLVVGAELKAHTAALEALAEEIGE